MILEKEFLKPIEAIIAILHSEKFTSLNVNNAKFPLLEEELKLFLNSVAIHPRLSRFIKYNSRLNNLRNFWHTLDNDFSASSLDIIKSKYDNLVDLTLASLKDMNSNMVIPMENLTKDSSYKVVSVRSKDPQKEIFRLQEIEKERDKVKKQLDEAKKIEPVDLELIANLQQKYEAFNGRYEEAKLSISEMKSVSEDQKLINVRIDSAFKNLSTDSHLEDELKSLQAECEMLSCAIFLIIILFMTGYSLFLCNVSSMNLEKWTDYLPYTMSVPIFVALLWLLVYLKNRANKLSIELSSKLYNIRYLEGLMKMINGVSNSNEEALVKIGHIVDSIVDSFLNSVSENVQTSTQISSLEKVELKDNPYWNFLTELKEIIKLIKHE